MEDELPAEPPVEWDGYDEYPPGEFSYGENEVDDRLAKYKTLESESENEGTIRYVGETLPDDSDDDDSSDANCMVSYTRGAGVFNVMSSVWMTTMILTTQRVRVRVRVTLVWWMSQPMVIRVLMRYLLLKN